MAHPVSKRYFKMRDDEFAVAMDEPEHRKAYQIGNRLMELERKDTDKQIDEDKRCPCNLPHHSEFQWFFCGRISGAQFLFSFPSGGQPRPVCFCKLQYK